MKVNILHQLGFSLSVAVATTLSVAQAADKLAATAATIVPWDGKTVLVAPTAKYNRCVLTGKGKNGEVLLHLALRDNTGSRAYLAEGGHELRHGDATGVARKGDQLTGPITFPPTQATMRGKVVGLEELTLVATIAGGRVTGALAGIPVSGTIQTEDEIRKANPVAPDKTWPAWAGPCGDFSAVDTKVPLVNKLTETRLLWASEELVWGGRGSPDGWQVGGYAGPIIGGGYVFLNQFEGSGEARIVEGTSGRHLPAGRGQPDPRISGDDIIWCFDAATGQLVWKQRMVNASANCSGSKHVYVGMNSAYDNGKLYTYGFTRRIYCLDAKTGKLLWHSNLGAAHHKAELDKVEALAKGTRVRLEGDFTTLDVADGIPYCFDMAGKVIAFDPADGKIRWSVPGNLPTKWLHQGKPYIVAQRKAFSSDYVILEPATGKELLAFTAGVPMLTQGVLALSGDYLLSKVPVEKDTKNKNRLLAHKLSLTGVTLAWTLDEPDSATGNNHPPVFAGDVVTLKTAPAGGKSKSEDEETGGRVDFRSISTGKLIARRPFHFVSAGYGWSADGRIVLVGDTNHTEAGGPRMFRTDGEVLDAERWGGIHTPTCSYEMPMVHPYADGRLFFRGMKSIVCYDLRVAGQPGAAGQKETK